MSIVKKIDELSGTETRSRNIKDALDKYAATGKPTKNIEEAVKQLNKSSTEEPKEQTTNLSNLTKSELIQMGEDKGIEGLNTSMTKSQIINAIEDVE